MYTKLFTRHTAAATRSCATYTVAPLPFEEATACLRGLPQARRHLLCAHEAEYTVGRDGYEVLRPAERNKSAVQKGDMFQYGIKMSQARETLNTSVNRRGKEIELVGNKATGECYSR